MHVGLGQTGTRTIQTTLASNRPALARLGAVYPGDADAHHDLLALVHPNGPRHTWYKRQSISPEAAQCLADRQMSAIRAAAATDASVIFLSSEFFQALRAPQFTRLDHQIAALGYQLETLCYIREPLAHTACRIEQGVRQGSARIAQMMDRPYPPLARDHCEAALTSLGRHRVHLRMMENAATGGLTADVLNVAGLTPYPGTLIDAPDEARLCHDAVYLLDAINGDDAACSADRALFRHHEAELFAMEGHPFTLPRDVARRVQIQSRAEQDWIFRNFHIRYPMQVLQDVPSHWQEIEWAADALFAVSQTDPAAQDWHPQQQAAIA
ncbi:hypothetical protein A8B78_00320 [Jannaschia sp. EhC01]|nr:hypothetical protein A8B78_00320 [Jannaschia sp. EhC01]